MCELLVRRRDAPVEESPGKWHSGDVVVVMPDGHKWGRKEADPGGVFAVIKLPDVPVEEMQDLIEEDVERRFNKDADEIFSEMMQRRAKKIDMRNLPRDWMGKEEMREFVVDKRAQRKAAQ